MYTDGTCICIFSYSSSSAAALRNMDVGIASKSTSLTNSIRMPTGC